MPLKMLRGLRVAAIVADGFEQVELTIPKKALEKRKAQVEVLSRHSGSSGHGSIARRAEGWFDVTSAACPSSSLVDQRR